jgi:cytochrome c peroxidase
MRKLNEIHWLLVVSTALILVSLGIAFYRGPLHPTFPTAAFSIDNNEVVNEPIQPVPLILDLNQNTVALGKKLFNDPLLSRNNTISCASCHVLSSGGVDHLRYSVGINQSVGIINSPTVFNTGFNFRQFWDGRASTLEAQIPGPIHDPLEMASNWNEVVGKVRASQDYVGQFRALYPDGITPNNIANAIATFARSLYTPNSRFDQYLRGNTAAITADELRGYTLFKTYGCTSCHQGVNVGGNMYQRMGIVADYFADRGAVTKADLGLFNVTGNERDRYVFKVPSLRMAVLTAPYFHDGSIPTLEEAIQTMAYYQLGRAISKEEVNLIVQFLGTLPGDNVELAVKN